MKIKKNGKVIRLTESDLKRIVKKTLLNEYHPTMEDFCQELTALCAKHGMSCDCDEIIPLMTAEDHATKCQACTALAASAMKA